ncbi:hypothetical protein V6N13_009369 [Hibiscus sabdariffa]|uniref:Uncharacterized protein n=1 Tax=Hibiscus sabdariffa TaxID=183260 RepID=A0ABR2PNU9_9ROSI
MDLILRWVFHGEVLRRLKITGNLGEALESTPSEFRDVESAIALLCSALLLQRQICKGEEFSAPSGTALDWLIEVRQALVAFSYGVGSSATPTSRFDAR